MPINAQTQSRFAAAALDLGPQESPAQPAPAAPAAPVCPPAPKSPAQAAREAAWVQEKRMIARYQAGLPPVARRPAARPGWAARLAGWFAEHCLVGWAKALVVVPLVCLPLALLGWQPAAWGLAAWLVLLIVPFAALIPLVVLAAARRAG